MSQPAGSFNERYEQMRGSPAPPPASAIESADEPVVVDLAGTKPEGEPAGAPEPKQVAKAASTPAPVKAESAAPPQQAQPKKTVEELEAHNRELQSQLAARPAPPAAPAPGSAESKPAPAAQAQPAAAADEKPDPDKFPNGVWDENYIAELSRWTYRDEHRKQLQSDAVNAARTALKAKFDAAAAKHRDFHEVAQRQIPTSETVVQALQGSDHAGELFYYLGTHEAEAREIAALPPLAAMRKLSAIEAQFLPSAAAPGLNGTGAAPTAGASARPATIVQSRAPKPPTTVRPSSMPSATTLEDIAMLPQKDRLKRFTELRAKQGQKDAKRLVAIG